MSDAPLAAAYLFNLLDDDTRELVAGTALHDTVRLLDYSIASDIAQVIGEIGDTGETTDIVVNAGVSPLQSGRYRFDYALTSTNRGDFD